MLNRLQHIVLGFGVCALFALGCNNGNKISTAPAPANNHEDHAGHDHGDDAAHDHADHDHGVQAASGDSDVAKAMASLPAEDRAAAEKQKTCPVGDEPLGGMGTPVKVSVNGRDVFLCCEGCRDVLLGDPDKFLAKLPQE